MKVLYFVQCCCKFVLGCNVLNILILYMYIACDMQANMKTKVFKKYSRFMKFL